MLAMPQDAAVTPIFSPCLRDAELLIHARCLCFRRHDVSSISFYDSAPCWRALMRCLMPARPRELRRHILVLRHAITYSAMRDTIAPDYAMPR